MLVRAGGADGGEAFARAGEKGFSVLELVIASALLLLGLLIAGGLLARSQLSVGKLTSELNNPQPGFASVRLRRDLEGAQAILPVPFTWQSGVLALTSSVGSSVAWELEGRTLRRRQLGTGSDEWIAQTVLEDVVGWRWRRSGLRLVDVEVSFRVLDATGAVLVGVPRTWAPRRRVDRRVLRVALRGGAGALP